MSLLDWISNPLAQARNLMGKTTGDIDRCASAIENIASSGFWHDVESAPMPATRADRAAQLARTRRSAHFTDATDGYLADVG
jgi:hypothetical protein